MVYGLIFPTEATKVPDKAKKPSYLNIFCVNSDFYIDACFYFYYETQFRIEIGMDEIYFLGETFSSDKKPFLPNKSLCRRLQRLEIRIDWKYNPYIGRMGSIGPIGKAAAKMQKKIEDVCAALVPFPRLQSIEIACESKKTPPTGGGPDTSIPGPSLTRDILRPFELLQLKKPSTEIWITDIENLTGLRSRCGEWDCKSLETTMMDLAYQLGDRSGRSM